MENTEFAYEGTLISGTMLTKDVATAAYDFLANVYPRVADEFAASWGNPHTWDWETPSYETGTRDEWDKYHTRTGAYDYATWEVLFDRLNSVAPEGFYFGSHPGDGSDYGFWAVEDEEIDF